ncbi:aldehyde dehydrogenase family 8 member A1-like [Scleropages formosus]|uniref:Aldehyde dehydrogenase family 8 member A1-like n=1 Tax=Scleropages formosus TaxID=113540 RepID=A0A0P7TZW4_SCLFO|nr:aldehyde dehydrogenase family 8 member A1-like [Scleropages formosus]
MRARRGHGAPWGQIDMAQGAELKTPLVLQNYIGGEFVPCSRYIDSYDPSTGEVYCQVPDSGPDEVEQAVNAAKEAFSSWAARSPADRARILNKLADLLEAHLEEFAQAESRDQGKTVTAARAMEVPRAVYNFRFFASSVLHHMTECSEMPHAECVSYTVRRPVGVAGLISPWNLPLYLLTWKIAPAIATGNTVVAKPSEMTSVTAWMLCKLLKEAVGDALVSHPEVPLVSFTGSTATARLIAERSAPYCKKLSMELGGKNPAVIFEDADLEECVATTVRSSFSNQGEICLCTSRVFVERSLYPEFLQKFVVAARQWKTGCPLDKSSNNGALISKEHLEKVRSYVKLALSEGGVVHCGEGVDPLPLPERNKNGYFMGATVITGVADESRCMQEEIFGPVAIVTPFDGEEEAVRRANNVRYGLSAVVWSRDVGRVHRVAQQLQAGIVWTNCWLVRDLNLPFGGMKCSGVGREGGWDSYHFFTEVKTITVKH